MIVCGSCVAMECFHVTSRWPNEGTAAMLVSQTNPPGIELYSYAKIYFCFG